LVVFAGDVGHNLIHLAIQDPTQVVDRGSGQGFVVAELVNGGAGNAVVFDERIGGFAGAAKCIPKWTITYHGTLSSLTVHTFFI
jgi:hypothetical protein